MSLLTLTVPIAGSLARLNSHGFQSWLLFDSPVELIKLPKSTAQLIFVEGGGHLCFKDCPLPQVILIYSL